jgi:hypothetical protein
MRTIFILSIIIISIFPIVDAQENSAQQSFEKHGVVWSAGLFKSWLKDNYVGFNKIGNTVTPVFIEQKKMGFSIQSHYMYKPVRWMGIGIHLGLGLDVYSYIEAPVVLFGASLSFGNNHQFIIDFGWADGKRKIVPGSVKADLVASNYTEIPDIHVQTELNTGYYIGLGYRIF